MITMYKTIDLAIIIIIFFFNDTATTEIYTLSLHDALPISWALGGWQINSVSVLRTGTPFTVTASNTTLNAVGSSQFGDCIDRKSTRLNSSHTVISYAVFCLKKKKNLCEPLLHILYNGPAVI